MSSNETKCVSCESTEDMGRLEKCAICARFFCAEHAHRAFGGRRFCSPQCAKAYYFHGESDDDDKELGPAD